jgi:hypothetical protein
VTLFDNDNGFAEVAEYKNGKLIMLADKCPEWIMQLKAALSRMS